MWWITRRLSSVEGVREPGGWLSSEMLSKGVPPRPYILDRGALHVDMITMCAEVIVNRLSLSSYNSADLSLIQFRCMRALHGKVGSLLQSLLKFIGPSGLASIRSCVNLLH
jgi:hypothetical protein